MTNDFEPVIVALLAAITAQVTDFKTIDGRLVRWDEAPNLPAIYFRLTGVDDEFSGDGLLKTVLLGELWIYERAPQDLDISPRTSLLARVKSIRDCFIPDNNDTGEYTIGGLVFWCRIIGQTNLAPGDTIEQSIARVPVSILLP